MKNNTNIISNESSATRLNNHGLAVSIENDSAPSAKGGDFVVKVHSSNLVISKTKQVTNDSLESDINELISCITDKIDNDKSNSVCLTIDFSGVFRGSNEKAHILNSAVEEKFGFKLAIGSTQLDKDSGFHKMNVSLKSIPTFASLAKKRPLSLPVVIQDNIGELMEIGYHQAPSSREEVMDLLVTDSTYDRWSPLLIEALFMTLLGAIDGLTLIYTGRLNVGNKHFMK